jgi:protein arginine kinase activator
MLCDDCKKNPATIYFKEVLPDKIVELHLCDVCAKKRGLLSAKKKSPIEILQKLLKERSVKDEKIICPNCYLSFAEFKRLGRFGCSTCVTTFKPYLKTMIKQIHQSDKHVGREPSGGDKKGMEVYRLRDQLRRALEREAYEEAADIRDRLKNLGDNDVE